MKDYILKFDDGIIKEPARFKPVEVGPVKTGDLILTSNGDVIKVVGTMKMAIIMERIPLSKDDLVGKLCKVGNSEDSMLAMDIITSYDEETGLYNRRYKFASAVPKVVVDSLAANAPEYP